MAPTRNNWYNHLMNKTTKEILTEALATLSADNFRALGRGELVNDDYDGNRCYCALGHIALAAGYTVTIKDNWPTFEGISGSYKELEKMPAVAILAHTIKKLEPKLNYITLSASVVYQFNDTNAGKHMPRLVAQAFEEAIASLD